MTWPEIIGALGGQGIFLVAAAWLVKKLVSEGMAREAAVFESTLRAKADAEIERLRHSLQMTAMEHQVRFSKLHERRAEVVAELYKLLLEAHTAGWIFILNNPHSQNEEDQAREKFRELCNFIDINRIYLPTAICDLLDKFKGRLGASVTFVAAWWTKIASPTPQSVQRRNEVMLDACKALETELPALRKELENAFRILLGEDTHVAPVQADQHAQNLLGVK